MGNFCPNCGKKLEVGEICDCCEHVEQVEYSTAQTVSEIKVAPSKFMVLLLYLKEFIINFLKNPEAAGKRFIKDKNITAAIVIICFESVASGLFALRIYTHFAGALLDIVGVFLGSAKLGFGQKILIFFSATLSTFSAAFLLALLLFITYRILHYTIDFKTTLVQSALKSVILFAFVVLGLILSIVSITAGIGVLFIGAIIGSVLMFYTNICEKKDGKSFWIFTLMIAVFWLIVMFAAYRIVAVIALFTGSSLRSFY